jgi:hypothetical protein
MDRARLLAELRRLNGKAAQADHELQVASDVFERAAKEHETAALGERNEAAARFEGALRDVEAKRQAFLESLVRVWVIARRVAS